MVAFGGYRKMKQIYFKYTYVDKSDKNINRDLADI